jgi:hypothetical protein
LPRGGSFCLSQKRIDIGRDAGYYMTGVIMKHRSAGSKARVFVSLFLLPFFLLGGFFSCTTEFPGPDPLQVAAVSGGPVPRTGAVEVRFTYERDGSPLPQDAFRLSPRVRGTLSWKDPYTLMFSPAEPLAPGNVTGPLWTGQKSAAGRSLIPLVLNLKHSFPPLR